MVVNGAPLVCETRRYAKARCRLRHGDAVTGTPLFLMDEEVGAEKAYTHDRFVEEKEGLPALRAGSGPISFASIRASSPSGWPCPMRSVTSRSSTSVTPSA
ncbi:MAG TPA: hypothetical protein VIV12_18900 [Streptosporangiaceae bacterium]